MTASSLEMEQKSCFQFKANFLPCTVLQITRYDLDALTYQLASTVQRAPNFFTDLPVVIDLDKIKTLGSLNFLKLKEILLTNKMIPIGIRGGSNEQQVLAMGCGLPVVAAGKLHTLETKEPKENKETKPQKPEEPITKTLFSKLVTTPIRSGMQVYAKDSDLIVTAAVSQGAELLADGNIHIYGSLRGRVLAGVQGNTQARIFCQMLDAELVSIAGYYLTKEDMQNLPADEGMKQIYLENEQVRIETL